MMRVTVGEESNQATTLPDGEDKDQVPTTGGRDKLCLRGAPSSSALAEAPWRPPLSMRYRSLHSHTTTPAWLQINTDDTLGGTITDNYPDLLPAELVTKPHTFADACAHPSAKRLVFHGLTGTVNAVEVYGLVFIENDEAEAKAARSKALELASEVAVANSAAAVAE
eukprot:scaffold133369_cov93-Phaeocystis_antarctica.AAC.1